jgi:two-component system, OmpR family, phosphate regulon sensor histidine kinase PhoR
MWPLLVLLSGAGAAGIVHLWWRRRYAREHAAFEALTRDSSSKLEDLHRRLAQEEARQRALFDSMTEGVLVLDPDARVLLVNRAFTRMFHVQDDLRGRGLLEALRSHELAALVRRAAGEGAVLHAELELSPVKDRLLQVNATRIGNGPDASPGVLVVFHDLTRVKQLENTRREFVANVSHELRTPLSMIKGYVETLLDGAWQDTEAAPRFLNIIQKHSHRLTFLIEDLLTISRFESGQIAMTLQPLELQPAVGRVLDDLRQAATGRSLQLRHEVPPQLLVRADAERLHQVLLNLVDNAIKYGRTGGSVVVRAEPGDENKIRCSVIDDGPGIPPGALGRVFERFYRVDKARSREVGGTGLGLSIVKHIVQAHGGEVWVESEPGRGSRFHFTLPAG